MSDTIVPQEERVFATYKLLNALVDDPNVTSSTLLVALSMLKWANAETGECWPSIRTLAEKTGLGHST